MPASDGPRAASVEIRNPAGHALAYRPDVDGLRAVAVLPVLLFHAEVPGFAGGYLGVDIFFVISGFLITSLLMQDREAGRLSLARVYERRIRRIAPALLTVCIAVAIWAFFAVTPARMDDIAKALIAAVLMAANLWFLGHEAYFGTPSSENPLIHLWSLGVEEQFYLWFPVLVIATRNVRKHALLGVMLGLAVLSLLVAQLVGGTSPDAAFFRPDTRAWEMLLGAIFALLPAPDRTIDADRTLRAGAAWTGAGLLALSLFALPRPTYPGFAAIPVCLGTALILRYASAHNAVGRLLQHALPVRIGLISYSLYLWHQPLLAFGRIHQGRALSPAETAVLLAGSFVLAYLTWLVIEQPARNRTLRPFRRVALVTVSSALILAIFSGAGVATQGYAMRYGREAERYFSQIGDENPWDGRAKAIRMGTCHFRVDMSPPLERFLSDWNCLGSGKGARVLVVGDSHASDKAASLRLNGIEVGQMTGAGCRIVPEAMKPECRRLFDHVIARQGTDQSFEVVILSSRLLDAISKAEIDATVAYWSQLKIPIVWLGPMPEFDGLEDRKAAALLKHGDPMAGDYPVAAALAVSNLRSLRDHQAGRFATVDSERLYCALFDTAPCLPFIKDKGWLALRTGHLTVLGAQLFGAKLLDNPVFKATTGL